MDGDQGETGNPSREFESEMLPAAAEDNTSGDIENKKPFNKVVTSQSVERPILHTPKPDLSPCKPNMENIFRLLCKKELPLGNDARQNSHTQNMTKAALRILRRFLSKYGESREINRIPPSDLDRYLAYFFSDVKKKDGTEYGPHTLTCIFDSIDRYLRVYRYPASVKKDEVFYMTRENLRAKRKHLRKVTAAKKRLAQALEKPAASFNKIILEDGCNFQKHFPSSRPAASISSLISPTAQPSSMSNGRSHIKVEELEKDDLVNDIDGNLKHILMKLANADSGIQIIKLEDKGSRIQSKEKKTNIQLDEVFLPNVETDCTPGSKVKGRLEILPRNVSNELVEKQKRISLPSTCQSWNYTMADSVLSFLEWLGDNVLCEKRALCDVQPLELDSCIVTYIQQQYLENDWVDKKTIQTFWDNLSLHLALCNYSASIKEDPRFEKSQDCMTSLIEHTGCWKRETKLKQREKTRDEMESAPDGTHADDGSLDETTLHHVQIFQLWLATPPNNECTPVFKMTPDKLDGYLAQFFVSFGKDDEEFNASMLSVLYSCIDLYLQYQKYCFSIASDDRFKHSAECFKLRLSLFSAAESRGLANEGPLLHGKRKVTEITLPEPTAEEMSESNTSNSLIGQNENTVSGSELLHLYPNVTPPSRLTVLEIGEDNTASAGSRHPSNPTSDNEELLAALLEPDISLVEDDNEIVINTTDALSLTWDCIKLARETGLEPFEVFLATSWIGETREIFAIPPLHLNQYLVQFYLTSSFANATNKDADNLIRFERNLHNFLKEHDYPLSILEDEVFSQSRNCLAAKCGSNTEHSIVLKVAESPFTTADVALFYGNGHFGSNCPVALISTLWFHFLCHFNLSTSSDHSNLMWGDLELRREHGNEILVYLKRTSDIHNVPLVQPKIVSYKDNIAVCPVTAYKKYKSLCPAEATQPTKHFYLCISIILGTKWFSEVPMQKSHIRLMRKYLSNVLRSLKSKQAEADRKHLYSDINEKLKPVKAEQTNAFTLMTVPHQMHQLGQMAKPTSNKNILTSTIQQLLLEKSDSKNTSSTRDVVVGQSRNIRQMPDYRDVPTPKTGSVLEFVRNKPAEDEKLKEAFYAEGHAPNTIIKTLHDVNVFKEWLVSNQENCEIYTIPPPKLGLLLLQFFTNLKKRDGTDYEPNSLYSIYFSIDRFLKVNKYTGNIKTDAVFQDCRRLFQERRREFDTERLRDALQVRRQVDFAFSNDDIQSLRMYKLLGPWNPEAMLLALWYTNTILLGIHSQKAHLHILWGDIELQITSSGQEYLEYHQRATKSKLATCPLNSMLSLIPISQIPTKVFATPGKPAECPVELFKQFRLRRPMYTLTADSRFYLCPNQEPESGVWFRSVPMGRSRLASIPSTIWSLIRKVKPANHGMDLIAAPLPPPMNPVNLNFKPRFEDFPTFSIPTMNFFSSDLTKTNQCTLGSSVGQLMPKQSPSISLIPLFSKSSTVVPQNKEGICYTSPVVPNLLPQNLSLQSNLMMLPGYFRSENKLPHQNLLFCSASADNVGPSASANDSAIQIIPLFTPPHNRLPASSR